RYNSGYDCIAPTFPRLVGQRFPFPGGPRPREPGSPSAIAGSARATTAPSIDSPALFWVALRTFWSGWTKPLILVTPRTVVNWHRAGFRLYWTWVSRVSQVGGRKRVSKEVRALIFRMVSENPTLGSTAHSRRTAQAGLRSLGKECLAMDPANPKRSRCGQAMADVPQKPSRSHCGNGFIRH